MARKYELIDGQLPIFSIDKIESFDKLWYHLIWIFTARKSPGSRRLSLMVRLMH